MKLGLAVGTMGACLMLGAGAMAQGQSVEVLHWWTSGGEAAALNVLKQNLDKEGIAWKDAAIPGGGGEQAMATLRARASAGIPPTAVQMLGFDITEMAKQGLLADLNALAAQEHWDKVVPAALQKFSKHDGKWVAAPVNVHSTNWVWANREVLTKAGIASEPATWEQFIEHLEMVQKEGFVGLAHGGQPWQDGIVFDGVALATGGADFYRKAFIELDPKALSSATMEKIFQRMSQLRKFIDKDSPGRQWNMAASMVIYGKAGYQIMGDWAKGEFINAKKTPGKDFACFRVPGSQGAVSFNSDQFAMFMVKGEKAAAQRRLAVAIMDRGFQSSFNVVKGSAPARSDVPATAFDDCGKKGIRDLAEASKANTLVGSLALGHATPAPVKNAFLDVVSRHFNGQLDDKRAVQAMVSAARR